MKRRETKELFGTHLFDRNKMKERLPSKVWKKLNDAMEGQDALDADAADVIASTMKEWAISMGATHWSHWFHPLTYASAEKHNAFINVDRDGAPFDSFNGENLVQNESDASSFPSGGMRSTFEARGYTAWDISSPAFIMPTEKGGTLCIPSVFLSYDGTPLDVKAALLKSLDAIESRIVKLLRLLGCNSARGASVNVGVEQEFFLVDKALYETRPDLIFCRRTLIGAPFPKDQTLEAHYFASIPPRIMRYMEDAENALLKVGIIIEAKHDEVAPGQFEFCAKFARANLACDQNQLLMDIMKKIAAKHDLELLLHEKPFEGINGSGKHTNISLADDSGENLLQLRDSLEENLIPLSFIAALTAGAAEYHSLLTSVISTPGNALRIGGHEAPPNIMSVYLGKALDSLFKAISNKSAEDSYEKKRLNFGLKKLPNLSAHGSDRNRTSPLAFTGNKFEFRAPGSSQAVARPVAMLTAVWALGIDGIIEKIESNRKNGLNDRESALKAIADSYEEGAKIRFEGDAYSKEWREEAERRELAIPKNIVEGIGYSISPKNVEALSSMNIFTKEELEAYEKIRLKALCDTISAEATVLKKMTFGGVLPAIAKQIALEGAAASCLSDADSKKSWSKSISKLNEIRAEITDLVDKLNECDEKIASTKSLREKAEIFVNETIPITEEIRKQNDLAESLIDRDIYPFADYSELLIV